MSSSFIQQVPCPPPPPRLWLWFSNGFSHVSPPRFAEKRTKPEQPNRVTGGSLGQGWGRVLAAAVPFHLSAFQLTREFFTKELKKHYLRNNDTDVFSSTWNSVMITVSALPGYPQLSHGRRRKRGSCLQTACRCLRPGALSGQAASALLPNSPKPALTPGSALALLRRADIGVCGWCRNISHQN